MSEYTFSRFVYFDTNIISHLLKNRQIWSNLFDFLKQNDLTVGVSDAQLVELFDAKKLHDALVAFFINVPSGVLKNGGMILDEEVNSHPQGRTDTLLFYPLNNLLLETNSLQKLRDFFSSTNLGEARKNQLYCAQQMKQRHSQLKNNFPPSKTGKYASNQADEFAWKIVVQWLGSSHLDFLANFQDNIENFHSEVFLSVLLSAYVVFYKYYLGQREPKKLSDFGDLGHLCSLPYCELAIMERDMCNILNQIKSKHDILSLTVIRNIDFFNDFVF